MRFLLLPLGDRVEMCDAARGAELGRESLSAFSINGIYLRVNV